MNSEYNWKKIHTSKSVSVFSFSFLFFWFCFCCIWDMILVYGPGFLKHCSASLTSNLCQSSWFHLLRARITGMSICAWYIVFSYKPQPFNTIGLPLYERGWLSTRSKRKCNPCEASSSAHCTWPHLMAVSSIHYEHFSSLNRKRKHRSQSRIPETGVEL